LKIRKVRNFENSKSILAERAKIKNGRSIETPGLFGHFSTGSDSDPLTTQAPPVKPSRPSKRVTAVRHTLRCATLATTHNSNSPLNCPTRSLSLPLSLSLSLSLLSLFVPVLAMEQLANLVPAQTASGRSPTPGNRKRPRDAESSRESSRIREMPDAAVNEIMSRIALALGPIHGKLDRLNDRLDSLESVKYPQMSKERSHREAVIAEAQSLRREIESRMQSIEHSAGSFSFGRARVSPGVRTEPFAASSSFTPDSTTRLIPVQAALVPSHKSFYAASSALQAVRATELDSRHTPAAAKVVPALGTSSPSPSLHISALIVPIQIRRSHGEETIAVFQIQSRLPQHKRFVPASAIGDDILAQIGYRYNGAPGKLYRVAITQKPVIPIWQSDSSSGSTQPQVFTQLRSRKTLLQLRDSTLIPSDTEKNAAARPALLDAEFEDMDEDPISRRPGVADEAAPLAGRTSPVATASTESPKRNDSVETASDEECGHRST
jgi:hypothetical protein